MQQAMQKRLGATLFSGGRGVECLLRDVIDFVLAVEIDPAIAAVAHQLGGHTIVEDVCNVDFSTWPALDYLHASPVCKNASQAKVNGTESDVDIQTAMAVCRALRAIQPQVFTLENVQGYIHFEAYRRICRTLDSLGYFWYAEVLNAADYGVPQTRRRLILRAVKDALLPGLPAPEPWIGWHTAIEDLLPTLPESRFAPWQVERLPNEMKKSLIVGGGNTNKTIIDSTYRECGKPAYTVSCASDRDRAFLMRSQNTKQEWGKGYRDAVEPAMTITQEQPPRAWSHGRIVRMTPRALARFQSIPDWYELPERNSLACTVIGNAVPSLLMSKVVRPLL